MLKLKGKKILILISQPKHMLWVLKRTVSNHMLKLKGKKILTLFCSTIWAFVPYLRTTNRNILNIFLSISLNLYLGTHKILLIETTSALVKK